MTSTTIQLNDICIEAVGGLVSAIRTGHADPDTTWRASIGWEGGFRAATAVQPETAESPPNSVEQIFGALGSCLAIGYAANAALIGSEVTDLSVELEGNLDLHTFLGLRDRNAQIDAVRAKVHIDIDATDETIDALKRRAVTPLAS